MDIEALKRVSEVRRMLASGEARQVREDLRVSLREVASTLGMAAATVSKWETGQVQPRADAALKLADILGITATSRIPERAA